MNIDKESLVTATQLGTHQDSIKHSIFLLKQTERGHGDSPIYGRLLFPFGENP